MTRGPVVPKTLQPKTRQLWKKMVKAYDMEHEGCLILLKTALEAYDLLQIAQEQIRADGPVLHGENGSSRPHPALTLARDSRNGFDKCLRTLNQYVGKLPVADDVQINPFQALHEELHKGS